MIKRIILTLFLLSFMLQGVQAVDVPITIKTLPNHDVDIYVLDNSESYYLIQSFHKTADSNGDLSVLLNTEKSQVKLDVRIEYAGIKVASEKFQDIPTAQEITVELPVIEKPMNTTETNESITNESITQIQTTENVTETNETENPSVTGFAISEISFIENKKTIYIILAAAIALIVIFMFIFRSRKKSLKLKGLDFKPDRSSVQPDAAMITQLEEKINNAQKELNYMKNQEKITSAEKRLRQDQEELEKLRRGEI